MKPTRVTIFSLLSLNSQGPEQSPPHRDYVSMELRRLKVKREKLRSTVYPSKRKVPLSSGVPDCWISPTFRQRNSGLERDR